MIFILNQNPISLSFLESWSFSMVSDLGLVGGHGFEPPFVIDSPVVDLKVHGGLYLVCLTLHV